MNQWMNQSVNQSIDQSVNQSKNQSMNERLNEWMDGWMKWNDMTWHEMKWNEMKWMNEWVNEWMNEWVNEWLNEWSNKSSIQSIHPSINESVNQGIKIRSGKSILDANTPSTTFAGQCSYSTWFQIVFKIISSPTTIPEKTKPQKEHDLGVGFKTPFYVHPKPSGKNDPNFFGHFVEMGWGVIPPTSAPGFETTIPRPQSKVSKCHLRESGRESTRISKRNVGKFGVFFEMSQKASGFFKYP